MEYMLNLICIVLNWIGFVSFRVTIYRGFVPINILFGLMFRHPFTSRSNKRNWSAISAM